MANLPPLTPLASCTEEEVCVPLEPTSTGNAVAVADQVTNCIKRLVNREDSVLCNDGERVYWGDGSSGVPGSSRVALNLHEIGSGAPRIVVANAAGALGKATAPDGTTPYHIVGKNGGWFIELLKNLPCFEDICECEPDWLAGFQRIVAEDGSVTWCLVRMTPDQLGIEIPTIHFASTQTVQVTGTGTAGDPYKHHVKVSGDDGNIIEVKNDGIYVECCVTYDDVLDVIF